MMTTGKRLINKVSPYAKAVAAIAHPYRLAILYLLAHEPMEFRDLVMNTNAPENLLSFHLKQMVEAGWLKKSKIGKRVTYTLVEKMYFHLNSLIVDTPFDRNVLQKDK